MLRVNGRDVSYFSIHCHEDGIFVPVVGNLNISKGTNNTTSKTSTNLVSDIDSIYPSAQHILAFFTKCVPPVGLGGNFASVVRRRYRVPSAVWWRRLHLDW